MLWRRDGDIVSVGNQIVDPVRSLVNSCRDNHKAFHDDDDKDFYDADDDNDPKSARSVKPHHHYNRSQIVT